MSYLDDCALVGGRDESEYDREPLFHELQRLTCVATKHLLSVKKKSDLGVDFSQEQIALWANLLGQFQDHNGERYPGAVTVNDAIFATLAQLWYCQYGRRHHIDQGERLLRAPANTGSAVPKLAHCARFIIDVCTKVAVAGCRHAPLLATVEQLPATLVTYPRFPSRDAIVELMHDASFVITCVLRRPHEALKKGLTEMEMLTWELLTTEQQKTDRNKYQFQPSTVDLIQKRTFLTQGEIPALQGWMWKEQAASYVERFIPLCTNVFAQLECEYRLHDAFRVNTQKWTMPFQARENAHLWLNKKFTLEQAETLFKNLREYTCEHHLPMGMRIHRKRARSSTITPIDADLVMQQYLGTAVTLKITSVFQNETLLAAIAGEQAHPLYGYLFLAMLDLEWSRIAGKREQLLYLYADYVVPCSLFLFRQIEEEERPGQLRHNQFPRPRVMMVCGEWKVLHQGQWQEATTGTCKDLMDALLLMLLIIRDEFDNTLENDMNLSELTRHFLPVLRPA
jgi:hypothetical protein